MSGGSGQQQAVWLVKSGGKILGPYTESELCAKIRSREVLVIDEVTLPMSRWRVIRDEPAFAAVVEEVRRSQITAREDTEIQGYTTTFTSTELQSNPAIQREQKTVPPAPGGDNSPDVSTVHPSALPVSSNTPSVFVSDGSLERGGELVREYGLAGEQKARIRLDFRTLIWGVAIVVCGWAGWLVWRGPETRTAPSTPSVSANAQDLRRLLNEASSAWDRGDFVRALSLLRHADSIVPGRPDVVSRLAPLLVQLETQTVTAKRAIRDAMANVGDNDNSRRAELELGLSLASLRAEEFNEAERHCRSAIAAAPSWFPARFDCGVVAFHKKEYSNAVQNFAEAGDEPAALLMQARALLAMEKGADDPAMKKARAVLGKLVARFQDFRQEGLVLASYLNLQAGDTKSSLQMARAALDVDPQQTSDHWHDPYLYLEPLSWNSLVPYCRRIADGLKAPVARALLGLCLYKAGSRTEAGEILRNTIAEATGPELQLLQAVNAYIMADTGRLDDARAALRIAMMENPPALATLVKARVCSHDGDSTCAEQAWLDLDAGKGQHLAALVGLAGFRMAKGDRIGALSYVEKAKQLSPGYLPARLFYETGFDR